MLYAIFAKSSPLEVTFPSNREEFPNLMAIRKEMITRGQGLRPQSKELYDGSVCDVFTADLDLEENRGIMPSHRYTLTRKCTKVKKAMFV